MYNVSRKKKRNVKNVTKYDIGSGNSVVELRFLKFVGIDKRGIVSFSGCRYALGGFCLQFNVDR